MRRIEALALRLPSTREHRLLMIWGVVLAESAAASEWLPLSYCALLWLMGQASVALLLDWRRRRGAGVLPAPLDTRWLVLHIAACTVWLLPGRMEPLHIVAGATAFGTLALALLAAPDLAAWRRASCWTGTALGACGVAAAIGAVVLVRLLWWGGFGSATIAAAAFFLRWFDPAAGALGKQLNAFGFEVTVEPACSGFEGMVLIAAFTVGWLFWFRREYRFPQALVLIPVGVALSWCLNVARLVALMWIGSVAGREAALGGFHSQAGWILFTALAIAVCWGSSQVSGFRKQAAVAPGWAESGELPTTAWLAPFAAIQIAAMVSAAARSDFEWLYPLRTLTGAVAIGWYWKQIPWPEFRRWSIATGFGIAIAWTAILSFSPAARNPFTQLAGLGEPWHAGWIALRVLGAVAIVPVAEELAFRGILQPRFGLVASSICFGLLHGSRWLPGILAGLALGWLRKRCGLAASIAAHIVANLLLLGIVWYSGDWRFW